MATEIRAGPAVVGKTEQKTTNTDKEEKGGVPTPQGLDKVQQLLRRRWGRTDGCDQRRNRRLGDWRMWPLIWRQGEP